MSTVTPIRTRKPTCAVPWPCILVEGGEKSGKSFLAALLTASKRVGQSYWIEIGAEGSADEYGLVPGADFEIVEHDGTYTAILAAVQYAHEQAKAARDAGEPPTVLIVDQITAEWELLAEWADNRARARENRKRANSKRAPVPDDAGVTIGMDLWNDAKKRHRAVMTLLLTFPGIVVMLARAGEVAKVDKNGRPVENERDYKVRGEKDLAFDASAWIRLDRAAPPQIIGLRSVHAGVRPGRDEPSTYPDLTLDWLIFDHMRCDPDRAQPRRIVELKPGSGEPDAEQIDAFRASVLAATDEDTLKTVWAQIKDVDLGPAATTDGDEFTPTTLAKLVTDRLANIRDAASKNRADANDDARAVA